MGAAAGVGGAVEVEGGVSGLREAGGRCPPDALETPRKHGQEELWAQRQELAGRLKWRADTPG